MKSILFSIIALCCLYSQNSYSQSNIDKKKKTYSQYKNYIVKEADKRMAFLSESFQNEMNTAHSSWKKINEVKGLSTVNHTKFNQFYKSLEVLGGIYITHEKDNDLISSNGFFLPDVDISINPSLSEDHAKQIAVGHMRINTNPNEARKSPFEQSNLEITSIELKVCDSNYPNFSGQYSLAYDIVVESDEPYDRQRYILDANSGRIIKKLPLVMRHGVPGVGVCKYYGEQNIIIDSLGPSDYVLIDPVRNIFTLDPNLSPFKNKHSYWDLTNENQDEVALDAHYCTEQFYDFMLSTFNWKGLDNNGGALRTVIHAGDYVNASWNGFQSSYGDGDCNHGPLTTLEVIGHEFMHGVTDYTSDLIYANESGAINESMSDIFGKGLEYYVVGEIENWTIGSSFLQTEYASPFRSFEDPNSLFLPEYYKGMFWSGFGAVHTNSSIGNHWFYLLVNGGQGTNEVGEAYDITGIGMDKALQIVFLTQRAYLFPSANYNDFYDFSGQACSELFSQGQELSTLTACWKAVGLPSTDLLDNDLQVRFETGMLTFLCENDSVYNVGIVIENVGDEIFNPLFPIPLLLNGEEIYSLNSPIMPNDTVMVTHDVQLIPELFQTFLFATLASDDSNPSNNSDFQLVYNAQYQNDNLTLNHANIEKIKACQDSFRINFYLSNYSCNSIEGYIEYELGIFDDDNNNLWSKLFASDFTRYPGSILHDKINILLKIDTSIENLTVRLTFDGDPNLEDNYIIIPTEALIDNRVDSLYSDNFDAQQLNISGNGQYAFSTYQNNSAIITTGEYSFGNFSTLCPEVDDIFDANLSTVKINLCADLSFFESTSLQFDLIQFVNDNYEYSDLIPNGSILKLVAENDNGVIFEDYIYNQEEGVNVHHSYDLPVNFVGLISFEFFNNSGLFIGENSYLDHDVMVFDNLTFEEKVVSSVEDKLLSQEVYPNSTQGILYFDFNEKYGNISVHDLSGKALLSTSRFNLNESLDISNLSDGIYMLKISSAGMGTKNGIIVKMSN